MLDPDAAAVLARVLAETRTGCLKWTRDKDGSFRAEVGTNAQPILIRQMFMEATVPFDVNKLFIACKSKIERFAQDHPNETFYAFAIDASMLCFNSLEEFNKSLAEYQARWDRRTRMIDSIADMSEDDMRDDEFSLKLAEKYSGLDRNDEQAVLAVINDRRGRLRSEGCEYRTDEGIRSLRDNTGDWAYQGFADMEDGDGFDGELYSDHYYAAMDSADGHAPHTDYAIAMSDLVNRLRLSDAFNLLKRSNDFAVFWVDHSY